MKCVENLSYADFVNEYQNTEIIEYQNTVLKNISKPKVSVRISTYNHVKFIRDCLDGVLMQETKFPIEILIGEDESSDGTREICIKYAQKNPEKIRLFLHSRKNNIAINGQATGRFQTTWTNFQARGTYIAECEGDDYWTDPLKLQKQVEFLDKNPEYVICGHPFYNYDCDEERNLGLSNVQAATLTRLYRNIIKEIPGTYFNAFCGDTFMMFMLKMHGKGTNLTGIKPAIRRMHTGGVMSKKDASTAFFDTINTKHMLIITFPERGKGIRKGIMKMIIRYYKQKKAFKSGFLQFYFFRELAKEKVLFMFFYQSSKKMLKRIYRYILKYKELQKKIF